MADRLIKSTPPAYRKSVMRSGFDGVLSATVSTPYLQDRAPGGLSVVGLYQPAAGVDAGDGLMRKLAGTCPVTLFPKGFFDPVEVDLNETYVPG